MVEVAHPLHNQGDNQGILGPGPHPFYTCKDLLLIDSYRPLIGGGVSPGKNRYTVSIWDCTSTSPRSTITGSSVAGLSVC